MRQLQLLGLGFLIVVWSCAGTPQLVSSAEAVQPVKVLVVYHSLTGNTEKMAKGVVEGAKSVQGTVVEIKRVGEVTANALFSADAVVVGSPVYWSNMAGEVKTFFDDWQLKFGVFPSSRCAIRLEPPLRQEDKSRAARK